VPIESIGCSAPRLLCVCFVVRLRLRRQRTFPSAPRRWSPFRHVLGSQASRRPYLFFSDAGFINKPCAPVRRPLFPFSPLCCCTFFSNCFPPFPLFQFPATFRASFSPRLSLISSLISMFAVDRPGPPSRALGEDPIGVPACVAAVFFAPMRLPLLSASAASLLSPPLFSLLPAPVFPQLS